MSRAFVGFDGYIDTLFRVVRERAPRGAAFFETIADFSRHLASAAGQSADMELVREETRFGGNAPLLANALASLGMPATCLGAMGYPEIDPAFASLHRDCRAVSVSGPGETTVFEFGDGKLMFADLAPLESFGWQLLRKRVGVDAMTELAGECDLVCLVNWGGLVQAQEVWAGFLSEVLSRVSRPQRMFVDLADLSKRTVPDVLALLDLLAACAAGHEVTLGLNEHEAWTLHERLIKAGRVSATRRKPRLGEVCERLFSALGLHAVLVHSIDRSYSITESGLVERRGTVVSRPRISTGGGDHFNAGYCFARSLDLEEALSLDCAMTVSRLYIQSGRSPALADLIAEVREGA